ncbi:PP2C family protein-serine/threonine phosphatase [Streptomyces sp. NBC_00539]|uniref:PP2C family protein-serine/threonine phosphatase n=1 Tax=Streptomyces sp. NBC_00539 TaxID=2975770 RepID=UPI002E81BCBE|nr:SpoIIE family protein phosphatase [Streptomyces sp. NBC_00539]WUC63290.1 SpoIIE family protein phosphatase [Streptomyces sp. NBC_00539]
MSPVVPQDTASLKLLITREVAALRAAARRDAGVRREDETPRGRDPSDSCPCGGGEGAPHSCSDDGDGQGGHDPWGCVCAALPAIPVSAALLAPVRDAEGRVVDFTVRAGNHVRCAQWLDAPDAQVGRRLLEVQPGAAAGGLVDALSGVLETGRAVHSYAVDYTEQHRDGLHRTKLLYDAASCGDRVLTTWRPALNRTEMMSLDAQYIASMGWGTWDLLSGAVVWSEGLASIFRTDPARPLSLTELCDAVLPEDVPRFAKLMTAMLEGEEPPGAEVRFMVLGEVRTLTLVGHPVIAADGLPWVLRLIARDLTAQVRSRQRLATTRRQTERLREEAAAEHRVASALREALLPTHSAELEGLGVSVAAAYLPAEEDASVGGDWYKCRLLPDGRILLAIGDACGHGLNAVARMAQQRHALAGLAHSPGTHAGQLATWLNELLCSDPAAETATGIIGHIDAARNLRWASAGHPAPLLLRGDTATTLDTEHRGPLFGLLPGHEYATATVPLRSGDLLLLYTDGMVERRGQDITYGIDTLRKALESCAGLGAAETLDRVMSADPAEDHEDDACLFAIRLD